MSEEKLPESLAVALRVVRVLEQLGVRYVIGGSIASTIHGIVRSTVDVDIVAELTPGHVEEFIRALGSDFYVAESKARDAVSSGKSFNLIALDPIFKVDIFVAKGQPFETSQLNRRVELLLSKDPDVKAAVSTAEDAILAKLIWYRKGGDVSDRQWEDVLGVIRVQGSRLDLEYLQQMAETTGVADLLARALSEA